MLKFVIKPAVRRKIEDHGLTVEEVEAVLAEPGQRVTGDKGGEVYQALRGRHLVRVVVETDRDPPDVVTAYRTRDVRKYWQVTHED